jgi:hypothetical protein
MHDDQLQPFTEEAPAVAALAPPHVMEKNYKMQHNSRGRKAEEGERAKEEGGGPATRLLISLEERAVRVALEERTQLFQCQTGGTDTDHVVHGDSRRRRRRRRR